MVPAEMAMFAEVVADKPVVSAITDLCALSPGTEVGSSEAFQRAGVEHGSGRGQLGGLGSRSDPASKGPTHRTRRSGLQEVPTRAITGSVLNWPLLGRSSGARISTSRL